MTTAWDTAESRAGALDEVLPFYDALLDEPLGRRARSALGRASESPDTGQMTFSAYLADAARFFSALWQLSNVGKGTLSEIDDAVSRIIEQTPALIRAAVERDGSSARVTDALADHRRQAAATLAFFETLDAREHSRRLHNALAAAERQSTGPVSMLDYIDDVGGLRTRLLGAWNVGAKTRAELEVTVRHVLEVHAERAAAAETRSGAQSGGATEPDPVALVAQMLDELKPTEANVLRRRYGLTDRAPATLHEIATEIGVTRERVRQVQASALARLRHPARRPLILRAVDAHGALLVSLLGADAGPPTNDTPHAQGGVERAAARLAVMVAYGSETEWRARYDAQRRSRRRRA